MLDIIITADKSYLHLKNNELRCISGLKLMDILCIIFTQCSDMNIYYKDTTINKDITNKINNYIQCIGKFYVDTVVYGNKLICEVYSESEIISLYMNEHNIYGINNIYDIKVNINTIEEQKIEIRYMSDEMFNKFKKIRMLNNDIIFEKNSKKLYNKTDNKINERPKNNMINIIEITNIDL